MALKKSSFKAFFEIVNCCFTTCVYCDEFRRSNFGLGNTDAGMLLITTPDDVLLLLMS